MSRQPPEGDHADAKPAPRELNDLTRLWIRVQPSVAAYVAGMVWNSQDAEDIMQEVAEVCVIKFDQFDRSRPFLRWAIGIARNQILRYYQSKDRRPVFEPETLEMIADEFSSRELETDNRLEALRECLKNVAGRSRQLLDMRYFREQTASQIADRLGLSAGAVRVALSRVRTSLGECVSLRLKRGGHENG